MQITQRAYTAQREATSQFEASKKELPLKTKTTTTHRTEAIKKMLSESGPESVLASKGKYSHTRTFAAGRDQRAVLAFSSENKRVDGFVVNKDQQLVPIKSYDLPKELQQILNSDAFEAFLKDVHARLIQLHNGDFRLDLHQGLKGGVYEETGNIDKVKLMLAGLPSEPKKDYGCGTQQSRIIIENKCGYPLLLKNQGEWRGGFRKDYPAAAFYKDNNNKTLNYLGEIQNGCTGGILYNSTPMSPAGTHGYIALSVPALGRNFIVVCAFETPSTPWSMNRASVQIRASDGNTDSRGHIEGYGINATGAVTNMQELFGGSSKHLKNNSETSFNEGIENAFSVICNYDNKQKAHFIFTFTGPNNSIPRKIPLKLNTPERVKDATGLIINVIESVGSHFLSARQAQPNQNQNPEEKAEMPVPDQEPVDDNVSGMSDNMQGNEDKPEPGVQPQAKPDNNSSEPVPQIVEEFKAFAKSETGQKFMEIGQNFMSSFRNCQDGIGQAQQKKN